MKRERRGYPLPGDEMSMNEEGGGVTPLPGEEMSVNEEGGGLPPSLPSSLVTKRV